MVDKKGRRIAVQVPLKRYQKPVADSEELEDIRLYRKVKSSRRKAVPFLFSAGSLLIAVIT